MVRRRRLGHEEKPGHPRLDDEPVRGRLPQADFDRHPFAEAGDRHDSMTLDPRRDLGGGRGDGQRTAGPPGEADGDDPGTAKPRNSAAHCLDFGEFGHGRLLAAGLPQRTCGGGW